jgi:gliding motility associated protien GldN
MRKYILLLALSIGPFLGFLQAQVAEDIIITESGEIIEPNETEFDSTKFYNGIVKRSVFSAENKILPYAHLREADVPWEKRMWRIIDTREKINLPFRYPKKYLFEVLTEGAQSGEITIFTKDDFKKPLSGNELEKILFSMDTSIVTNLDTYEDEVVITPSEINPDDIKRYRVMEMWYFDKTASRMKVRILGISPLKESYDDMGFLKYELPLFWVYFPEAREYMSKHQVYNDWNDAAPMSWADLFEDRKFSSYLFKATNVQDYALRNFENLTDKERLIEGDNIQMELFNFEHDFWEY